MVQILENISGILNSEDMTLEQDGCLLKIFYTSWLMIDNMKLLKKYNVRHLHRKCMKIHRNTLEIDGNIFQTLRMSTKLKDTTFLEKTENKFVIYALVSVKYNLQSQIVSSVSFSCSGIVKTFYSVEACYIANKNWEQGVVSDRSMLKD